MVNFQKEKNIYYAKSIPGSVWPDAIVRGLIPIRTVQLPRN